MARSEGYFGPMFARKTQHVVGRLEDAVIAEEKILVLRPVIDDRVERTIFTRIKENEIFSKYRKLHMVDIKSKRDFWRALKEFPAQVIAIDESQFCDQLESEPWFAEACLKLLDDNADNDDFLLLFAGLDTNYKRQGYGPVPRLICEVIDKVHKLRAICNVCKKKTAIYTYRKAKLSAETVVGGKDIYEARCRRCFPKTSTTPE